MPETKPYSIDEIVNLKWLGFEVYPQKGCDIVIHMKGFSPEENKNYHALVHLPDFDPVTFNVREHIPDKSGVVWSATWLPYEAVNGCQ